LYRKCIEKKITPISKRKVVEVSIVLIYVYGCMEGLPGDGDSVNT